MGLGLSSGKWVMINCGRFPSEISCKLVIMAPEDQRSDLVEAVSVHVVKNHGYEDTPELREELYRKFEDVDILVIGHRASRSSK